MILTILIENSLKYTFNGSVVVKIFKKDDKVIS